MGILRLLALPFRIAHQAWVSVLQRGDTRLILALPAAGLDEATSHQILFTLRAAASTDEVKRLGHLTWHPNKKPHYYVDQKRSFAGR